MRSQSFARIVGVVAALLALPFVAPRRASADEVRTVFVIALENHNFTQPDNIVSKKKVPQPLLGNAAAPFFNSLITPGNPNAKYVSYASHYSNAGKGVHPSEGSYIWSECGTNFNPDAKVAVLADHDPSEKAGNLFKVPHLTSLMDRAGISWKDYQEDVDVDAKGPLVSHHGKLPDGVTNPYNGTNLYDYAAKHNPMCFFADAGTRNIFPLSKLEADLTANTVGRYNWITPDQYNEMHSPIPDGYVYHGVKYTGDQSAIAAGDHCLSVLIPLIESSKAFQENGVIVIWTDETEGGDSADFTLPEVIISPLAKGNAYNCRMPLNRSSDLKTMQEIFHLGPAFLDYEIPASEYGLDGPGHLNTVAGAPDLSDLFIPGTIPTELPKTAAAATTQPAPGH